MGRRIPVPDLTSPQYRPTASPADTFVQTNGGQGLGQLASALAGIAPTVGRFVDGTNQRINDGARQRGQLAASDAYKTGMAYKDAIKQGKMQEKDSPFYRAGFDEQYGAVSGEQWHSDFTASLGADPQMQVTTDITDFDTFAAKHLSEWQQTHNGEKPSEYFQVGFKSRSNSWYAQERAAFADKLNSRMTAQANEMTHVEVMGTTLKSFEAGASAEDIGNGLTEYAKAKIAQGRNPTEMNTTIAQAVVDAAKRTNNKDILRVLDHIKTGSGTLALTGYGSKMIEAAEGEIDTRNIQSANAQSALDERATRTATSSILGEAESAIEQAAVQGQDVTGVDLEPFVTRMGAVNPKAVDDIFNLRDAHLKATQHDTPSVAKRLFAGLDFEVPGFGRTTYQNVQTAFTSGNITQQTYLTLRTQLADNERKARERANQGGDKNWKNDPMVQYADKLLNQNFQPDFHFDHPEVAHRYERAYIDAVSSILQWRKEHPNASPLEQQNQATAIANREILAKNDTVRVQDMATWDSTIAANSKPDSSGKPPDMKLKGVYSADDVTAMQNEVTARQAGRQAKLSDRTIRTLFANGVNPNDPKAIQRFFDVQRTLRQHIQDGSQ